MLPAGSNSDSIDYFALFGPEHLADHPPADDKLIRWAEKKLRVKLPQAYIDFVKNRNGADPFLNGIISAQQPFSWHTSRTVYEVPELNGISRDDSYNTIIENTRLSVEEWGGPKGLVALGGEGHWWLCLDYRDCGRKGEPTVVHSENGTESPSGKCEDFLVANNFAEFIGGLRLDHGGKYILGVKTLDHETIKQRISQLECEPDSNAHPSLLMLKFPSFRSVYESMPASIALGEGNQDLISKEVITHSKQLLGIDDDEIKIRVDVHADEANKLINSILQAIGSQARVLHSPIDCPQLA